MTVHTITYTDEYIADFATLAKKVEILYPEPLDPADRIRKYAIHDLLRHIGVEAGQEEIKRFVTRTTAEVNGK